MITNHNHGEMPDVFGFIDSSRLLDNRTIIISEGIDSDVAKRVIGALVSLEAKAAGEPITIYQNSPGGEVNSGFAIFDMIRFLKSPVRIVNTGLCASIATVINCAVRTTVSCFDIPSTWTILSKTWPSCWMHCVWRGQRSWEFPSAASSR